MKLTPENIAAIEDLLTRREKGEANPKLASSIGLEGKSGHNKISQFVSVLRALGVGSPERRGFKSIPLTEWAAFSAWKAAQQQAAE